MPFTVDVIFSFDGQDSFWFTVTDQYGLVHMTLIGDALRVVKRQFEPVTVTEKDLSSVRDHLVRFAGGREELIDWSRIPKMKPAIESFALDDRGHVWVVPARAARAMAEITFDVFDPGDVHGVYHVHFTTVVSDTVSK